MQYITIPVWQWFEYDNAQDGGVVYDAFCRKVDEWLLSIAQPQEEPDEFDLLEEMNHNYYLDLGLSRY